MRIDVVFRPSELEPDQVEQKTVIVFDVLRATTTIAAALAAGVAEIHVFAKVAEARAAAAAVNAGFLPVLCGEEKCLRPDGFQLGNSPSGFDDAAHRGRSVYMSTTNGTRALIAARGARHLLAGALVNAAAVAKASIDFALDITLLCAGTDGQLAAEDLLGAGAVIDAVRRDGPVSLASDRALAAESVFVAAGRDPLRLLRQTSGGKNVIAAGFEADIDFAARLNVIDLVGMIEAGAQPVIRGRTYRS